MHGSRRRGRTLPRPRLRVLNAEAKRLEPLRALALVAARIHVANRVGGRPRLRLRARYGCTTTIDLEIDGQAATACIPVVWVGQDTELGPSTFTIGEEMHSLEILAMEPLAGAVYQCLP